MTHEAEVLPWVERATRTDPACGLKVIGRSSKSDIVRLLVELGERV